VFAKVVQALDSYDPAKASAPAWVHTITRDMVTDDFRARSSIVAIEDYMLAEAPGAELTDDALDNLAEVLLSLKEKGCGLIVLSDYQGGILKTVAQAMDMPYINATVIHKKALTSRQTFSQLDENERKNPHG